MNNTKPGGAPANFAYHASQFGFDSRVVSAVGEDRLGDEILESFDDKQLKYVIERVPYPTGTVQVQVDGNGIPGYEIRQKVADTVGAGDSFTATFCSAILKERSVHEAHQLAVEVSAYVCTQHGAMPELPPDLKNRLI